MLALDFAWVCAVGFVLSWLIVLTVPWHGHWTADHVDGVQKMHTHIAARVGGVPIYMALVVAWYLSNGSQAKQVLATALLAGLPALLLGLLEDVTKRVGVGARFLATMASGVCAWSLTGVALTEVDVLGLDQLLQIKFVAVIFTAVAIAGVANAVNIIDGMNGLAALTSIIMLAGLAAVSWQVADMALYGAALCAIAAVLGFFALNWPWGKLFLGDGGAYFLGFWVAWLSILLVERHAGVSPFAPLLICIYPVTEVLFSIWRRWQRNSHPGHPDRHHFHSLFKRRYSRYFLRAKPDAGLRNHALLHRNASTGVVVASMNLWGLVCVYWAHGSTVLCLLAIVVYVAVYLTLYFKMVRYRWPHKRAKSFH